ncbi:MAG: S-layer homology domain-containing protein [Bacillota bacterium]|nr:S-layer homology domain-containing protein [Bacillota bacterium]
MFKKFFSLCLCLFMFIGLVNVPVVNAAGSSNNYVQRYEDNYPEYLTHDKVIADDFLSGYNNSEAQALVTRAIWYMENGYMIYGHSKYWDTGYIDCSNYVSLIYKDLGYEITSASKKYNQVGEKVDGVYFRKIAGSSKYELVGTENLRPGDIFTYWKDDTDGNGTHIGHVALYMGEINGQPTIIQTNSDRPTAIGIRTDFRYWYGEHFVEARRVLDNASQVPGKEWQASSPVIPDIYQLAPQNPVIMPEDCFMSYSAANGVITDEDSEEETDTEGDSSAEDSDKDTDTEDSTRAEDSDEKTDAADSSSKENSDDDTTITAGSNTGSAGSISGENTNKQTDTDVSELPDDAAGHWAEKAINQFLQEGYITGYPDGQFRPDNTISRAEFTTILVKSFHLQVEKGETFSDTDTHWASDYISTAAKQGIVNGYSDTRFGPDDSITREQMLVMLVKASQLEVSDEEEGALTFSDLSQISDWAENAVFIAYKADLISGYADGTFKPQTVTTRAEAVTVISKSMLRG